LAYHPWIYQSELIISGNPHFWIWVYSIVWFQKDCRRINYSMLLWLKLNSTFMSLHFLIFLEDSTWQDALPILRNHENALLKPRLFAIVVIMGRVAVYSRYVPSCQVCWIHKQFTYIMLLGYFMTCVMVGVKSTRFLNMKT